MTIPSWKSQFEKIAVADPREADLKKAFSAIQKVADAYEAHSYKTTSSPAGPDTSKFRATIGGGLEPFRNRINYGGQYGFDREMLIGMNIGSNFGMPSDYKPGGSSQEWTRAYKLSEIATNAVKKEVKKILQKLIDKHGGRIHEFSGSNYGGVGWVIK